MAATETECTALDSHVIADELLKSRKKLVENANSDEAIGTLKGIWYGAHPEDQAKVDHQMKRCGALGSPWVLHQTVCVDEVFDIGKVLGTPGQYGTVKEGTNRDTGTKVAIKFLKKHKYSDEKRTMQYFKDLRTEIYLLDAAKEHPYIIDLGDGTGKAIFEDIEHLYIVMEHCSGGELYDRIQELDGFSEKHAQDLIRQMVSALYYLHSQGIAHCDLKPENFVFKSNDKSSKEYNTLKMIDFGMAKVVGRGQWLKTLVGTPYYTAPEIIGDTKKGIAPQYGVQSDIWSVGVITFVSVFGFPPFYVDPSTPNEHQRIYKLIRKGFKAIVHKGYGAFFPKDIPVSDELRDFIAKCLVQDPAKRMTSDEALAHPWFGSATDKPISETLVTTLKNFRNKTKFKRTILTAIGHTVKSLTHSQQSELEASYEKMDVNHDGKISYEEFSAPLYQSGVDPETIKQMFQEVDLDNSGDISKEELRLAFTNQIQCSRDERLYKAFAEFDKDGNGQLSRAELVQVVTASGIKEAGFDAAALLEEADADGDGQVSWQEFARIMSDN